MIFISVIYDLVWIALKTNEFSSEKTNPEDGGIELGVRRFSLNMSYLNFFVKLVVALVYWKDSLDFENIIQFGASPVEAPR